MQSIRSKQKNKVESYLPEHELNFFKQLGYFFKNENTYFILLYLIFSPIVLILTYYYLHWLIGLSFLIGYTEFLVTFYLCRKLFVKTMRRMNLTQDSLLVKNHNWKLFLRFLNSDLLIFNMSTSILSTFSILLIFNKLF